MKRHTRGSVLSLLFFMWACADQPFYDVYHGIDNRRWGQHDTQVFQVHVDDTNTPYDIYFSVRHTNEYSYENLSFILHEKGPSLTANSSRQEIQLSKPDGRWAGRTAGNLYENTVLLKENYVFPDTGVFMFEIEQNMQENPLRNITDVGIKIIRKK